MRKSIGAGSKANEEQSDLNTNDRSGDVSKYVGETKKSSNKVFLKVEPNNLMLFINRADVLLGKRSTLNQEGGAF